MTGTEVILILVLGIVSFSMGCSGGDRHPTLEEMGKIGMYTGKTQAAGWMTEVSELEFTSSFKEVYALLNTKLYATGAEYKKRYKLIKEDDRWKIDSMPIV